MDFWIFLVSISGIVFGFCIGRARYKAQTQTIAVAKMPAELPVHLETLREVLSATGDLTPEAEAWIAQMSEPQPALPPKRKRPLLEGDALRQFRAEYDAYQGRSDDAARSARTNVRRRWHSKGYYFGIEIREEMMRAADDSVRPEYIRMFDEQDADI